MPSGAPVNTSIGPPNRPYTIRQDFDGGGNVIYTGWALSQQTAAALVIASVSKAVAAVFTSTAHGLTSGQPVVIAGATGDWAGLNGTRIITVTGANTFTVAVDSSAYAGSFDATATVTTTAPRTNALCWALSQGTYSGSNNTSSQWAQGSSGEAFAWDSRTTYAYQ